MQRSSDGVSRSCLPRDKEAGLRGLSAGRPALPSGLASEAACGATTSAWLPTFSPPSPRQAVWWLIKDADELEQQQKDYVKELTGLSPEIKRTQELAKEFRRIVRQREGESFDAWREAVKQSGLTELKNFSEGLMKDEAAVRAAMKYRWSNGPVEGEINRLKLIKRQMFGRAGCDLLKARVLNTA